MEKQTIHDKAEHARVQHKAKMKEALAMTENMPWKEKQREIQKLSKISFRYYTKSKKQQELEKSKATIEAGMRVLTKCAYCGSDGLKTDGDGILICENRANTGEC